MIGLTCIRCGHQLRRGESAPAGSHRLVARSTRPIRPAADGQPPQLGLAQPPDEVIGCSSAAGAAEHGGCRSSSATIDGRRGFGVPDPHRLDDAVVTLLVASLQQSRSGLIGSASQAGTMHHGSHGMGGAHRHPRAEHGQHDELA